MYANEENDHSTKQLSIPHSTTPSLLSQKVLPRVIYHYRSTFTILATNCRIII
jgi:hypothetical protein